MIPGPGNKCFQICERQALASLAAILIRDLLKLERVS